MNVATLFPTPLYKDTIPFDIDPNYLGTLEYQRYGDGTGFNSVNQKILLEEPFLKLKAQIDNHVNYFYYEVLQLSQGNPVHISSWINLHHPGDYAPIHNHTNSCYSGVYYLNAPENGGGIFFHHPNTLREKTIKSKNKENNMWNTDYFFLNLEKDMLLVFPSLLPHSTEPNNSNMNRYSIAFNYFIEGELGHETSKINIRIVN